ncbi:MAG TPA: PAS domain S-box protein [Steroidobacteraceae bacterium]
MKGFPGFADWPLRWKLAALLGVASLLPLALSTFINSQNARDLLLSQAGLLLESRADYLVGQLDAFNEDYLHSAERVSHVPAAMRVSLTPAAGLGPEEIDSLRNLLGVLPSADKNVIAVAILDASAVIKASSQARLVGINLSAHRFVQQALHGSSVVSDVHYAGRQVDSVPAVAYAAPIMAADNSIGGCAVLWIRATGLWNLIHSSNEKGGSDSLAALLDEHGIRIGSTFSQQVVFHPSGVLPPGTFQALVAEERFGPKTQDYLRDVRSFPEVYRRSIATFPDGNVFRATTPVNRGYVRAVGRRLKTAPWTVFYLVPEDTVLAPIVRMTRQQLLFAAIIAALALIVAVAFLRTLLRPVRTLTQATEAIAGGNLTTRVDMRRGDELGLLGARFNAMAERIQQSMEAEVVERAQAQEISRVSRQLLQRIVESSEDAIISKTPDGLITSWNAGAEKLFGYSAQEAIGQPARMLFPPDRQEEEQEILHRVAESESVDHLETIRVRKDGTHIEVSATISPLKDGQGKVFGASTIARDISVRKAQERRVHAQLERLDLLEQVTRAIGERQDLRSIFTVVLGALEERLPIDFGCVCLYSSPETFVVVNSVGAASQTLAQELSLQAGSRVEIDGNGLSRCVSGKLVYEPELMQVLEFPFPQRLAGGGLRAMVIAPLRVESHVFGVLVAARRQPNSFSSTDCEFLRQITEHTALAAAQTELYNELKIAYDDLRQTQQSVMQQERLRALGQMASGIAHDINNAISPIMLYAEFILEQETDLSARTRDFLTTMQQAISDVSDTVARMREFYREREPQMALKPVRLNELAAQVIDLTRARWSDMALRKGLVIRVQTDLTADLPEIMGVESELREAFTNLMLNASDALPQGGTITLRTRVGEQPSAPAETRVHLEVSDNGVGMTEETRQRCLEPFFTTKGEQGTGLGLAMVYGTAQRHGADVEIESAQGLGTTVRLSFPLPTSDATAAPEARAPLMPPRMKILVVDDDPVLLKSLRDTLEGDGHAVEIAPGGETGIDLFRQALEQNKPFSVVITDLGMPNVDGRKVAAAVKAASPGTPVLLLTGWGQRLVADDDVPAHIDKVLSKPPRIAQLRGALAEIHSHAGTEADNSRWSDPTR